MNKDSQKATIEGYLAAYNTFDIEGMLAFIHPKVVFKNITGDEVTAEAHGINELRTMADQSKSLFSSRCQQASNFYSIGGTATIRWQLNDDSDFLKNRYSCCLHAHI